MKSQPRHRLAFFIYDKVFTKIALASHCFPSVFSNYDDFVMNLS